MSDEKPSRKIINVLPDSLKASDGKGYPADIVKEAFIRSEQGLKGFCRRFGLSAQTLEKYIQTGEWDKLREQYRKRMFDILNSEREDILERKQAALQRVELFKFMQIEKEIQDLEEHALKFGDFFVRDEDGEIVRDGYGNPVSRKIVLSKKDMEFLKDLEAAREINRKIIEQNEEVKTLKATEEAEDVIDVGNFFDDK